MPPKGSPELKHWLNVFKEEWQSDALKLQWPSAGLIHLDTFGDDKVTNYTASEKWQGSSLISDLTFCTIAKKGQVVFIYIKNYDCFSVNNNA